MREKNVPLIDGRYWAAIVVASILGTSFGDFVSNTLELGFGPAALMVGSVLAVIFIAERMLPWTSVGWYWGAVVFTRTAATCLGDFLTRSTGWGNGPVSAIVAGSVVVYLFVFWLIFRPLSLNPGGEGTPKRLPMTNTRYWLTMLAISVLGTTLGDYVSDDMGYGLGGGALFTSALLAIVLFYEMTSKTSNEIRYWWVIAHVRVAGTIIADYMTEESGLNLGFGVVAALVATLLLIILFAPRKASIGRKTSAVLGN
jgi:uncharacterized membrane-anchored protein